VLADQLGRSVGDMYAGAIFPGLVLNRAVRGLCSRHHAAVSQIGAGAAGRSAPAARLEACRPRALRADPPLALIFLVLGTIFLGIATPTEGGAMGATGALALALINRRLKLGAAQAGHELDRQADFVVVFHSWSRDRIQPHVPRRERRPCGSSTCSPACPRPDRLSHRRERPLPSCSRSSSISFELAFIIVPLLAPVADKLGIDLIWFGVAARCQHADLVHAPAVRLRAVLPAQRGPGREYLDKISGKSTPPVTTGQIYWGRCRSW